MSSAHDMACVVPSPSHSLLICVLQTPHNISIDRGRLRLRTVLARGGSSVLFRACDETNGREYAVKCMPRGAKDSELYARRVRERHLHIRVHEHPNIVTLHRAFAQEEHAFFVFDLYLGGDLYTAIERGIFVAKDSLVRHLFLQLCDAVGHCHALGVYHLDVKPENILYDHNTSHVVLSDFGMATTQSKIVPQARGSKPYTPPECLKNGSDKDPPTPAAARDVWALGIVLINLITTLNPWNAASPQDSKFALYLQNPRHYFEPLHLPEKVEMLILDALLGDPYQRIPLGDLRESVQTIVSFFPEDGHNRGGSDADSEAPEGNFSSHRAWLHASPKEKYDGRGRKNALSGRKRKPSSL